MIGGACPTDGEGVPIWGVPLLGAPPPTDWGDGAAAAPFAQAQQCAWLHEAGAGLAAGACSM
jgi:hypothetical protein